MLNYPALDLVFQALADPSRRTMVERLSRGPASVSDLAQPFDMSLPAVMQHLQVLETSGLVRSEKSGRVRMCRIEPKALAAAEGWFTKRRATWERRFDRLETFLAAEENAQDAMETKPPKLPKPPRLPGMPTLPKSAKPPKSPKPPRGS
jgi:DNA-binding transcriptional ArsR family regulator